MVVTDVSFHKSKLIYLSRLLLQPPLVAKGATQFKGMRLEIRA
jgi:hypothetical protein